MQAIGAIQYDPGKYDGKANTHAGYVTAQSDTYPYPEFMNTKATEKRRDAQEKAAKRNAEVRSALLIFQCEQCASMDIEYGLLPKCKRCGHVHKQETVSVSRLSIAPEETNPWDEIDQVETQELPAIEEDTKLVKGKRYTHEQWNEYLRQHGKEVT